MARQPTRMAAIALVALFFLVVFAYSFNAFKESDSFYHLKTGQVIWETKSVPHADIYSYTAAGAPWVTHEWLAEVALYGVYALGGYWAVMFFVALLAVLTYALVLSLCRARAPDLPLPFTLLAILLLGYLTFELWIPRPQVFAFLLCVFLIYLLERYRRSPHLGFLVGSVFVVWLWANLHASFLLGLALIGVYAVVATFTQRSRRGPLWLAFVAATALAFVNPNTYHLFIYWHTVHATMQVLPILEWKSILAFVGQIQTQVALTQLAAGAAVVVYWFGVRKESRDLTAVGIVLGLSVLPFIAIRHFGFWAIGTIPLIVLAVGGWLGPFIRKMPPRAWTAIFVAFAALFVFLRYPAFPRTYFDAHFVPVSAADFVDRSGLQGPLFNLYNEGGYLIWRFYPREKVSIDGRTEVYVGRPVQEEVDIARNAPDWSTLVNEKYHIDYFFLAYNPPILFENIKPLLQKLNAEQWPIVYWDDEIVIYARPVERNRSVIEQYGLRYVNPFFVDPTRIPQAYVKPAIQELQRVLDQSPENAVVQEYARRLLTSHTAP